MVPKFTFVAALTNTDYQISMGSKHGQPTDSRDRKSFSTHSLWIFPVKTITERLKKG